MSWSKLIRSHDSNFALTSPTGTHRWLRTAWEAGAHSLLTGVSQQLTSSRSQVCNMSEIRPDLIYTSPTD